MEILGRNKISTTLVSLTGWMDAITVPIFEMTMNVLIPAGENRFVVGLTSPLSESG